jgi:acyl-homoserine lactone acylase PvdQ
VRVVALALVGVVLAAGAGAAAPARDHAEVALNILPPGENGSLNMDRNTNDQAKLYDALTPLLDKVTNGDVHRLFKPATLGLGGAKPTRIETLPRRGLRILRDRFGVPHVRGRTKADVAYGAGWATAEDRGLLLSLIRGPARAAALDIPGLDPIGLALSGTTFVPSAQTEAFLGRQITALRGSGRQGRLVAGLIDSYVAGVNGYYRSINTPVTRFTVNDVVASAALIAARFGANGGDEPRRSEFLDALQRRLGPAKGRAVFDDLRASDDPEAPASLPGSFPYEQVPANAPGSVVLDDGSVVGFTPGSQRPALRRRLDGADFRLGALGAPSRLRFLTDPAGIRPKPASNAILVGASRSATRRPFFVAGPQVGYFFPQFFLEADLHGGGFDTRGAIFPGVPFVVIGRGLDYVWSATSSQADNRDVFAETLCGGDSLHYLYRGECRVMSMFDAGTLRRTDGTEIPVSFNETVHGPVIGRATVGGRAVALALDRSTRGRELLSARAFYALDTNSVTSGRSFLRTMNGVEFSFNWFYADNRDIAMFSSGRLPLRVDETDPSLPTLGTGEYDWRGFLSFAGHPQGVNPRGGLILNWNNKSAAGFGASDDNWSYGPVQRVQLLQRGFSASGRVSLAKTVSVMNMAATQDLRAVALGGLLSSVLAGGRSPSPRDTRMLELLNSWRASGASRLDGNGDGKIDDPGAAIMDAAYPRIARAVMEPVLGPLADRLARLHEPSDDANNQGSSYIDGWYGYIAKDLRTQLGQSPVAPFSTRYCGAGDLDACRASLWAAIDAAGNDLAEQQGPDPAAWRADATPERIRFTSGILPDTMRWTNRPTFQQVFSFRTHRAPR